MLVAKGRGYLMKKLKKGLLEGVQDMETINKDDIFLNSRKIWHFVLIFGSCTNFRDLMSYVSFSDRINRIYRINHINRILSILLILSNLLTDDVGFNLRLYYDLRLHGIRNKASLLGVI